MLPNQRNMVVQQSAAEAESAELFAEDNGSNSDEGTSGYQISNRKAWQRKVMYLAVIGVFCIASGGILIAQLGSSDEMEGYHGVFDAPQFEQMLWEQIEPVVGSSVANMELSGHIKQAIGHMKVRAQNELPKDQALALKNAQITTQNWADLKTMARASRNSEVRETGKLALNVINENLFSSNKVIAQRLKESLAPHARKLIELRSQMVPPSLDIALGSWATRHNESHAAWKGLLDSGSALQPIRNNQPSTARRLGLGTGGAVTGAMSVVLVAIGEILVHCEIFIKGFSFPEWAWKLILTPMGVMETLACKDTDNRYCKAIEGMMGLNALDATFILFCQKGIFGLKASNACKTEGVTKMQEALLNDAAGMEVFKDPDPPTPTR
jgi:hypothetical protein